MWTLFKVCMMVALNPKPFRLRKCVANCMKQVDDSYHVKVDLTEGLPSLGASRLTMY
jgi:hypothetical protein